MKLQITKRIEQLKAGWTLMEPDERRQAYLLGVGVFIFNLIDLVAISSILPLLGLITSPDTWLIKPIVSKTISTLGQPGIEVIVPMLAILISAFLLVAATGNIAIRHFVNGFGATCMKRLAASIAGQIDQAPLTWSLDHNSTIVSRQINQDTGRWGHYFIIRLFNVLQTLTLTGIAAAIILFLAPLAGAIAIVAAIIFFGVLMKILRPRMDRYARTELKKSNDAFVYMQQMLNGIKDVKLSRCSTFFVKLFTDAFATISDITARRTTIQQALPIFLLVFGQLSIIIIITLLWANDLPAAEITEQMILIALISSRLVPALNRMFSDLTLLLDTYPAIRDLIVLRDSLTQEISKQTAPGELFTGDLSWTHITFKNVGFTYPKATKPSLNDINVQLERGKAYGLAGSSGSGKTTLADILLGLLKPTQGQVMIADIDLFTVEPNAWYRYIGYVPQHPFMTDDTLRSNIAFGIPPEEVDDDLVRTSMQLANIAHLEADLPHGLHTPLGDKGAKISGGQRQRIAIARALYKKPEILILDEATSALDSINEAEVQKAIRNLHGRITTVIIAHRLSTISWCDEIFLLSEGKIVGQDTYSNLRRESTLFRKMVDLNHSDGEAS